MRLRFPILGGALFFGIDHFFEQLTRISLGVFGGLPHNFGSFLKGFVRYVRRIPHIIVRHSAAAVVAHIKSLLLFA